MPVRKLKSFLDDNNVKYVTISHSPAFTAQEVAAAAHIPGKELAKTVMVKLDDEMALAILPASHRVALDQLQAATGARSSAVATESEFRHRFPDCQVGAMPPFGRLYGMRSYVAETLADDEKIAFNAGTHTELIQLSFEDFRRLEQPTILRFARQAA